MISEINYLDSKLTNLLNSINNINIETDEILSDEALDTDWKNIKTDVESIYNTIPTITLDLYKGYSNQNEILSFNKELDNLTVAVENEDAKEATAKLANLHEYLPKYANEFSDDVIYKNFLEIKTNVLKAYAYLDSESWQDVDLYVKKAIEINNQLINNISSEGNENEINKIYIILNELSNAVNLEDEKVFLIKYKMFLIQYSEINKT